MKTILVTGAAGYIGRHVVKKALDMGYRVIASDFAFKGVDERAEFCDVPIFSGDKNIYAALGKPGCLHPYGLAGWVPPQCAQPHEGSFLPCYLPEQYGSGRSFGFDRDGHHARSRLLGGRY